MTAAVAPVRANRFVFIAGLHRSGTSLLFQCLRDHPEISAFRDTGVPEDEGQHLQTVYPRAAQWGGPGTFGFHPEAHMTEASPLVTDGNRKELFAQSMAQEGPGVIMAGARGDFGKALVESFARYKHYERKF